VNLDLLKTFVVAAEALNFTKAAEALYLTQPAVSQHVKELEAHFGQPLFERRGRQVTLSVAGRAFLPHARELLARWDEANEELAGLRGQVGGALALGAGNTAGVYLLPRLLGQFREQHPHVKVTLKVAPNRDLLDMLGHGALDLALVDAAVDDARRPLERTLLLQDELVLIAPPGARAPLGKDTPLLVRAAGSATDRAVQAALGFAPRVALELGSTEAIKQGVMAGLGWAFVSRHAIQDEVAAGRLVVLEGPRVERPLWLVAPERRVQPGAVQQFRAFLLAGVQ
jgi:DNA-binding transcriptional LysR family regulator